MRVGRRRSDRRFGPSGALEFDRSTIVCLGGQDHAPKFDAAAEDALQAARRDHPAKHYDAGDGLAARTEAHPARFV